MSSSCDAVNINVRGAESSSSRVQYVNGYYTLQETYGGYARPNQVSALPFKTEASGKKILQVVPSYGGIGLSTQTVYGVAPDATTGTLTSDGPYFSLNFAYRNTNSVCGTTF